jgi:hypothetical protein
VPRDPDGRSDVLKSLRSDASLAEGPAGGRGASNCCPLSGWSSALALPLQCLYA